MGKSVLAVIALGIAVFTLVVIEIGSVVFKSAAGDSGAGTSVSLSYVESRSTQPFLVRYTRTNADEPAEVFALEPGSEGGTLARFDSLDWTGTVEVLRPDCSVVGSIGLAESANTYFVVWEGGRPERVPGTDVIDGPTDAALPTTRRCGGS